jgi:RHS repeat-associated protein
MALHDPLLSHSGRKLHLGAKSLNLRGKVFIHAAQTVDSSSKNAADAAELASGRLFYNMNRYYDPSTGRYTQPDPLGEAGGFNPFNYVSGNPISSSDFFGLQAAMGGMAGGAAGGSGLGGLGAAGGTGGRGSGGVGGGRQSIPDDGSNGRGSCTLYHIVDCAGETVYVGITQQNPRARESQHTNRPDGKIRLYECVNCKMTYVPVATYQTRAECEAAETREIVALRPFANDAKNPDTRTMQYQKYQEWFSKRCIPCQ